MSTSSRHLVPLLAMASLLLAGCGDDDTGAVTEDEPAATQPDDAADDSEDDTAGDTEDDPPDGADDMDADDASDARADDGDLEDDTDGDADADADADVHVGSTELGDVLVDADGMTLYLFTNDSDGQSACYDDCAAAWPPMTVDSDPVAGDGVDAGLLGTIERDDGSTQVTYDDSPLYTWAADSEPGDVTGQGVNDVWFVVAPDGEAIMDSDDPAAGAAAY